MRKHSLFVLTLGVVAATSAAAQNPQPGGRGGGRGRRAVEVMKLSSTAWQDGGVIPTKFAQPGRDVSPMLSWSPIPEGTNSFVLIAHDIDGATGNGTDDLLHWLVWNIPKDATSLPEGIPQAPQRADGSRQISASRPYYRGPAAPSTGPAHHYVFEIFALDTLIDVPSVGVQPGPTRAAVMAAMAGHVRGKGTMIGTFKRAP
jgi:Raf kinase inhibitor-like YbhB/YbcL family protein